MQEKLKLSKSQGASTPAEKQRMQNIPYASAIGSIMYAVRCTRPDVAFAQNMTSRFQQNPGEEHWTAVKNILKYLRNTKDMFLVYGGNLKRQLRVSCYTDAGYLTDADNLKSQTGYVFVLNGGAVDWKSTKQSIFATSSTDAEYIAAFDASKEAVWIRKFISGLGIVPTIEEPISMYCDNTGAIAIAKDDGVTKGARHFRAKVHYLRETIKMGDGLSNVAEVTASTLSGHSALPDLLESTGGLFDNREFLNETALVKSVKVVAECLASLETASEVPHDAVTSHQVTASPYLTTASARADSKADLEDSIHDGVTPKK
ncbi:hypothetical protein Tco_1125089 [Tanacetum coccineum]|uniref:Retrotransposon protein, putative, Ty1-copia subclass n=1 Tax=Tanacetum coccineum TaxID=301880 RepID=A0ABQ5J8H9_9ASTR